VLTIYRRHRKGCKQRAKGRKHRHCQCPIWVDGSLGGKEMRESLKLRDWQRAQELVREWEAEDRKLPNQERKRIEDAWKDFLTDTEARKLHDSTRRKYRLLKREMEDFAQRRGLNFLDEFDLPTASQFRSEWTQGPRTSLKKLERLRAFFRFAQKRKWVAENPASELKAPKTTIRPTLPLTQEDMKRTLAAVDKYKQATSSNGLENARRLRGLVLLLRYSGMRISDAVQLTADRLAGRRLFLYMQKTGEPVNVVLPDFVLEALEATPRVTDRHFFWSGKGKPDSIVRSWQARLRRLFELAEVPNGHPHRLRDTFAVELLLAGVPIERVSVLLGHQSVRITERHYNPWNRARQEQLEADLMRAWEQDPLVLTHRGESPTDGRRVHGRYTEGGARVIPFKSKRKVGARGGSRTHMRKNPRRILSPQRLPFRHPGTGIYQLNEDLASPQHSYESIREQPRHPADLILGARLTSGDAASSRPRRSRKPAYLPESPAIRECASRTKNNLLRRARRVRAASPQLRSPACP
jgi:integrase/recombinase XerD